MFFTFVSCTSSYCSDFVGNFLLCLEHLLTFIRVHIQFYFYIIIIISSFYKTIIKTSWKRHFRLIVDWIALRRTNTGKHMCPLTNTLALLADWLLLLCKPENLVLALNNIGAIYKIIIRTANVPKPSIPIHIYAHFTHIITVFYHIDPMSVYALVCTLLWCCCIRHMQNSQISRHADLVEW